EAVGNYENSWSRGRFETWREARRRRIMKRWALVGLGLSIALLVGVVRPGAETPRPVQRGDFVEAEDKGKGGGVVVLKPARVFDGVSVKPHTDWVVVVRDQRIEAAGP